MQHIRFNIIFLSIFLIGQSASGQEEEYFGNTESFSQLCPQDASFCNFIVGTTVMFFNLSNSGDSASFFWDFGDGTTSSQESPQHSYQSFGIPFNVTLIVTDTCGSDTAMNTIFTGFFSTDCDTTNPLSIAESFEGLETLLIYPNPTSGVVTIDGVQNVKQTSRLSVELYDITGRKFIPQLIQRNSDKAVFSIHHFPSGFYILRVWKSGQWISKRLIKE